MNRIICLVKGHEIDLDNEINQKALTPEWVVLEFSCLRCGTTITGKHKRYVKRAW